MRSLFHTVIAASLVACGPSQEVAPPAQDQTMAPQMNAGFESPSWSGVATDDAGERVASVNGVAIYTADVERVLKARPTLTAAQALDGLVETELLAQARWTRGSQVPDAVSRPWREALAQRYLHEIFERESAPEAIPIEEVRRIYAVPSVRKVYDHADAWRMAHLFFTCCDPKIEACDTPEIISCFSDAARTIQEVYAEVKRRTEPVEGEPDAVVAIMEAYRLEMENALPQLAFRKRPFYYDPSKSHGEQKGYNLLAEAVARTVVDAPLGVIQEPVQSPFGWHVLVQVDHVPEERRGIDDPEVVRDIRQNLLPRFRRSRLARHIKELHGRYTVVLKTDRLSLLGGGGAAAAQAH